MAQLLLGKDVKAKGTEQEVLATLDRKYQCLRNRLFEDALRLKVNRRCYNISHLIRLRLNVYVNVYLNSYLNFCLNLILKTQYLSQSLSQS